MNLHDKIKKYALDKDGKMMQEMPFTYPEKNMLKDFKQALKDETGCR